MRNFIAGHGHGKFHQAALLATGGLVGAGVALLFAPKSGKAARRSLARFGASAQKGAKHFQSDLNSKMDHLFTDIRHDLRSRFDDGRTWTADKRTEIERALKTRKRNIEKEVARVIHS